MNTIWNSDKRKIENKITLLIFAFLLNLFVLASQTQVYGQMSCGQFDFECKIKESSKLIEISPRNPLNYYNRAIGHRNFGENTLAIQDYSKAIELNANFYQVYFNRSVIFYELGKTDEAIVDILKVIELNPEVANAHFFYGYIYFDHGKYEEALEKFNKAIEINPEYAKAYKYRAKTFDKLGDTGKANADLETLAQL